MRDLTKVIQACMNIIPNDVSYRKELEEAASHATEKIIEAREKEEHRKKQDLAFTVYFCGKVGQIIPEEDQGKDWEEKLCLLLQNKIDYKDYLDEEIK